MAPKLRITLAADGRDWRQHLDAAGAAAKKLTVNGEGGGGAGSGWGEGMGPAWLSGVRVTGSCSEGRGCLAWYGEKLGRKQYIN